MTDNALFLLDTVLQKRQDERDRPIPDDKAFEIFACEQVLRDFELTPDEIVEGVVGGGNDGGLDGIYVFLNEELLSEDHDIFDPAANYTLPRNPQLRLVLIQAKREQSFTEVAFDRVRDSAGRLLELGVDESELRSLYEDQVVNRTGMFRLALKLAATRHPSVHIEFVYATKGSLGNIHNKVQIKARSLEEQFARVMPGAIGRVQFVGASELYEQSNKQTSYTMQLTYRENATSDTGAEKSHVVLVKLEDYLNFITADDGSLRRHIFDWNVRDFEGNVEVNAEIEKSLREDDAPEFWWLNNGITIVCSKATVVGKTFSLDDVQVVNGLQTSHTIYNVLSEEGSGPARDRSVLVRVLVTGDDAKTRDRVIRATNRQTTVTAASLRATDEVQRNIEVYFAAHGWWYDRRKNYYRNNGKSPERIIGIPFLAQAVMAMGLSRPNDSRARPSSLLKKDSDYELVFSAKTQIDVFLWLARSQKAVDAFLLAESSNAQERTNLRFHLAMYAASKLMVGRVRSPQQLRGLVANGIEIESADLTSCYHDVKSVFIDHVLSTGSAPDKSAKGTEFRDALLYELSQQGLLEANGGA